MLGCLRLTVEEFIQRFCLDSLPESFIKIRHYATLANRNTEILRKQQTMLGVAFIKKEELNWKEIVKQNINYIADTCHCCKTGKMVRILSFEAIALTETDAGLALADKIVLLILKILHVES